jgi:cyclopropane fatty-acyl-phospholipid synthase-like methyltransferase
MDRWKYFDITHKMHLVCNPMEKEKFYRLCGLLPLGRGSRVLDIACGKGEFLVRLAELHGVSGVGVDLSPYCIRDCERKKQERVPEADLVFIERDGADYTPEEDEKYHLASCIGASWVYGGYRETLQALQEMTTPGGWVVVGEPFWRKEPSENYLESQNMKKEDYGSHAGNVRMGEELGHRCVYTLVSDEDDWDHYETLQWLAAEEYVTETPDDPDNEELLSKVLRNKNAYLEEGRSTQGWAVYVFKKPS